MIPSRGQILTLLEINLFYWK